MQPHESQPVRGFAMACRGSPVSVPLGLRGCFPCPLALRGGAGCGLLGLMAQFVPTCGCERVALRAFAHWRSVALPRLTHVFAAFLAATSLVTGSQLTCADLGSVLSLCALSPVSFLWIVCVFRASGLATTFVRLAV